MIEWTYVYCDVYTCCVDATKAVDRVEHDKLFDMLIER